MVREVYMPVLNTRCRRDLSQAAWSCCSFTDSMKVVFVKFHVASEEFRECVTASLVKLGLHQEHWPGGQ